jgi:hypothetical protein
MPKLLPDWYMEAMREAAKSDRLSSAAKYKTTLPVLLSSFGDMGSDSSEIGDHQLTSRETNSLTLHFLAKNIFQNVLVGKILCHLLPAGRCILHEHAPVKMALIFAP